MKGNQWWGLAEYPADRLEEHHFMLQDCEVVLVSAAAGATGMIAGQLFKHMGCVVIGATDTDHKVEVLAQLGYDHAFNHNSKDFDAALSQLAPNGVDVYFDNVGGQTLDVVLPHMRTFGRIIACGSISTYDTCHPPHGVTNLFCVVTKSLTMQGFLVSQYQAEWPAARAHLQQLLAEGVLQDRYTTLPDFADIPRALTGLFTGLNVGKMLVACEPEE
eukprot:NODE_3849_length_885_cov_33.711082_g3696_i0.p1 GENE.NODE_3849_length_885_cov_33.711082_g3696_i0~~NODE_3849_length_885_cov_33.711082_g3696_i0.p1  ORF type:complete len:217 (-),score=63.54 NODE_3849_length_885_cov_33.711082_g3696_i0:147-797(-)